MYFFTINALNKYIRRLILLTACILIYWFSKHPNSYYHQVKVRANYSVQLEERQFPIAYTVLAYTDVDRLKRLLKVIYRPQNHYCVHVDKKTDSNYFNDIATFAAQLGDTIHVVPDMYRIDVQWGSYTMIKAELLCAQILLKMSPNWRYLINLTGQEFPLKTNWEIVKALKRLNGSNMAPAEHKQRHVVWIPPSHLINLNITWYEGTTHVLQSRPFVEFMFSDYRPIWLLNALRIHEMTLQQPIVIDEQFYATLNNNPNVIPAPGAYTGEYHKPITYPIFSRYKLWLYDANICPSHKVQRGICILGLNDVPRLKTSNNLFANKFLSNFEPQAYDALEDWLYTKIEFEHKFRKIHWSLNEQFYGMWNFSNCSRFEHIWMC